VRGINRRIVEAALLRTAARSPPSPDPLRDVLLREYGEVCANFRTLTDIRFRLLALLPVGTLAAAFFGFETKGIGTAMISFLGLAATTGLFVYSERNDQLYGELAGRAAELERRLGIPDGNFANRPRTWLAVPVSLGCGTTKQVSIDHGTGLRIIYGAAFAAWLFGILFSLMTTLLGITDRQGPARAIVGIVAVVGAVIAAWKGLHWYGRRRNITRNRLRGAACRAILAGMALTDDDLRLRKGDAWLRFEAACEILAGNGIDVAKRAEFYLSDDTTAREAGAPSGRRA
jgi:hypothetical protein